MSTEVNLMQCVVKAVAVLGFENASMKTIAKNAGISPSTIYCHFDSKESMFEKTFMHLSKGLCNFYAEDYSALADADRKVSARRFWDLYLNQFLLHQDEVLFYVRYRHSAYYTDEIRRRVRGFEHDGYYECSKKNAETLGFEVKNDAASVVMRYFIESLLLYAEQRILGKAQPIHDDFVFEVGYASILTLEKMLIASGQSFDEF